MFNTLDSSFFWCEDMCRAGINYAEEQCLQFLRREAMRVEDVDRDFILALTSATAADFVFDYRYLPVYSFKVTARYTKDGNSREVVKTGIYYQEKYADCRPDFFVGGQSSRFFALNLPRDLEFPLLSANGKGISEKEAANRAVTFANDIPVRGERRSIKEWSGTVCFVPILFVKFTYEGRVYSSYVNMHNGTCVCETPSSKRDETWAKRASRISSRLSSTVTVFSLLWLALAGAMIAFPEPALYFDFGFAAVALVHLVVRLCRLPKTDFHYWLSVRKRSVHESLVQLNRGRKALLFSSLLAVLLLGAQIALQFVL